MIKEERHLRNFLSGGYCPQSIPEEKKVLSRLIREYGRAVREDCIASYHDYLDRPTKFNGISFEDALRKGMRWRKTAIREKK